MLVAFVSSPPPVIKCGARHVNGFQPQTELMVYSHKPTTFACTTSVSGQPYCNLPSRAGPMYDVFISYSHAKDKPLAAALQTVIQTLAKPWWRRRVSRVFRDDTSLAASAGLGASIETALANSHHLVLLASPEAARSKWVEREVETWLTNKGSETFLIALTAGSLAWDDAANDFGWSSEKPLPPALRRRFKEEPLWVDLTGYRESSVPITPKNRAFLAASATIVAAIRGQPKEDLLSEEVTQQRRNLMWARGAVLALTLLAVAAVWQAFRATEARHLAEAQRDRAQRTLDQVTATANRRVRALSERTQRATSDHASVETVVFSDEPEIALAKSRDFIKTASSALANNDPAKALSAAHSAVKILDRDERGQTLDPRWELARFEAYREKARAEVNIGKLEEGVSDASAALGIAERWANNDLKDVDRQVILGKAHDLLADVINKRKPGCQQITTPELAEAERHIRNGLDIWTALAGQPTQLVLAQRNQALGNKKLAEILFQQSKNETAIAALQKSATILEPLAATASDPMLQTDLAETYERMADVLLCDGKKLEATEWLARDLALTERLAASRRNNNKRQADLSVAYDRIGRLNQELGHDDLALQALNKSLAIMEPLIARERERSEWQRGAAATHEVMGYLLAQHGQAEAAVTSFRRALALREQLAASFEEIAWQKELEAAYRRASEQLLHMDRAIDALDTAEQYLLATSLAPDLEADKPVRVARALGTLTWTALFARNISRATWAGKEATALAPELIFAKLNYAHALMYAGETSSAREIYLSGIRGKADAATAWRKSVRKDFATLIERGLRHTLMAQIDRELGD